MYIKQIINSIFSSNTYILEDENNEDVWLVDIGDIDKIIAELQPYQTIRGVFITHSHFDHIYGINELVKKYPDCLIYISEKGKEGLYNDKINFSFYHEKPIKFIGGNIHVVKEGSFIEVFKNQFMTCLYTPGHDESCMCYLFNDFLFTGDSYIPNEKPVTKLKGGNKQQYENSLLKIFGTIHANTVVCPGHGNILKH